MSFKLKIISGALVPVMLFVATTAIAEASPTPLPGAIASLRAEMALSLKINAVPLSVSSQLSSSAWWTGNKCMTDWNMPPQATACMFGDLTSKRTVVTYGDSYSEQWGEVFDHLGKKYHFKVLEIGRLACTFADVTTSKSTGVDKGCAPFRKAAIALINALQPAPDLIVLSQNVNLTGADGKWASISVSQWIAASVKTINELNRRAPTAVILGSPMGRMYSSICLGTRPTNALSCNLTWYLGYVEPKSITAFKAAGALVFNVAPLFCVNKAGCPAMMAQTSVFAGLGHVNAAYAPHLEGALTEVMGCTTPTTALPTSTKQLLASFFPNRASKIGTSQCAQLDNLDATFK